MDPQSSGLTGHGVEPSIAQQERPVEGPPRSKMDWHSLLARSARRRPERSQAGPRDRTTVPRGAGRVRRSGTSGLSERSERGKRSAEPDPTSAAPPEEPGMGLAVRAEAESRRPSREARETERSRSEFPRSGTKLRPHGGDQDLRDLRAAE